MTAPHDIPDAAGLLEAVREFLERDLLTTTQGRVQFHTRVAINVLAMVEREIVASSGDSTRHSAGLVRFSVTDEAALADAIRDGSLDERLDDVRRFVTETVRAKLEVANPRYLEGPKPPVA